MLLKKNENQDLMNIQRTHKKFINDLTFEEANYRVLNLARKLYDFVKNDNRVALLSSNSEDMALFFLSLQCLGKEVLMLNARLTDCEIKEQLNALNIRVVLSHDNRFISFGEVYESKIPDANCIDFMKLNGVMNLDDLITPSNQEAISVYMNTSATTGRFKTVPIKWKQLIAHAEASRVALGVTSEDNWLMVLPMFHIGGLMILIRSLFNGTRVTIMEKCDSEETLKLIHDGGVNMISVVPTMLNSLMGGIDQNNLRVVLVGGAFIPDDLVNRCIAQKIPMFKTYGMTETTSQSTTFSVLSYPNKLESVGKPLQKAKIKIHNPDKNGVGEILIKSPMLMDGYIDRPPVDDYFNTEDVGYIDEEGFLYVLDRFTNIIISGGENIYPKELENILYNHPEVYECAVTAQKHPKWGSVPYLYIVSSMDEDEIMSYLSERVARFKLPQKIIKMKTLPKNDVGKILKNDLRGC